MPIGYPQVPSGPFDRLYRRFYRFASRHSPALENWAERDALAGFQHAQRVAYDCVEAVAKQLHVGMTEMDAAQLLADLQIPLLLLARQFDLVGRHSLHFVGTDGVARLERLVVLRVGPIEKRQFALGVTHCADQGQRFDARRAQQTDSDDDDGDGDGGGGGGGDDDDDDDHAKGVKYARWQSSYRG